MISYYTGVDVLIDLTFYLERMFKYIVSFVFSCTVYAHGRFYFLPLAFCLSNCVL